MTNILLFLSLSLITPNAPVIPMSSVTAAPDCYTFTVDNATDDTLGEVSVNGASSNTNINVTGNGFYEQDVCFTAISFTINGQTVLYPNIADIQLADSTWVKAGWQSSSIVEVRNETQTGSRRQ